MSILIPHPHALGHLEVTSIFHEQATHMCVVSYFEHLYLFDWGHSVATGEFQDRLKVQGATPTNEGQETVSLQAPPARGGDLINALWSGFPRLPVWLSHSLTVLPGIISQTH